ncbi:MAG TPA: aminodeoxychorismate synthase component I [Saprospiraceae bacterium]|nr:aminodeoxychorismate synthase component I [Saprospiraceae bacterium]
MSQTRRINSYQADLTIKVFPHWVARMNQLGAERVPFLFILDFDLSSPMVLTLPEAAERKILFEMHSDNAPIENEDLLKKEIPLQSFPIHAEVYQEGFEKVQKAILAGDTYLLNLCYATKLSGISSLEDVFHSSKAPYKLYVPGGFVIFSPEQFVEIKDGVIRTFPMKGTIDATLPNAEEILLADIKEQEEHATVVDLLRNDLSIVAKEVEVKRYRYISEIRTSGKTLLQCSSEISGKLPADYMNRLGSIFYSLLPAGSVTGAPKKKTVELIHDIEPESRGYYTGVFGYFDGENLDSGVMIRMIEQRPDGFYYRSGGGITYRSEVRQEYGEMIDKIYIPR